MHIHWVLWDGDRRKPRRSNWWNSSNKKRQKCGYWVPLIWQIGFSFSVLLTRIRGSPSVALPVVFYNLKSKRHYRKTASPPSGHTFYFHLWPDSSIIPHGERERGWEDCSLTIAPNQEMLHSKTRTEGNMGLHKRCKCSLIMHAVYLDLIFL